ncbi:MAG: phosphoserine phosphatase RsbU/P [Acidobacteriota bacterium]|jgi:serine phosphatase RsbU (regulator of sigma subunit)|nr:phosphoserine phosphatase RsbU/P [Acidobacteriota bacterium]MDT7809559.1 phosphoserine phosphatase RsbU/P [Acidobacteriota bacterium]
MPELLVNYPDRAPERLTLGRLRITIGRSARNDVCVPDPFASRVHAEVRREGDQYFIQDLGSANGTYYNGSRLEQTTMLTHGGRIQIGETEIVFKDKATERALPSASIEDDAPLPEATIAFDSAQHTTSGLLETIEGARTQTSGRFNVATIVPQRTTTASAAAAADHGDLLALISKVGVTLLASATLDETLRQVALLVFDAVPAERCLIMLRDEESGELKIRAAEMSDRRPEVGEVRVGRTIVEEVVNQGRSVLTSDAQHDPRFRSSTVTFQGIRSVLAVPLGVGERIFGMIYADSPLATSRFTEDHLKVLTTLGSVAAIRVENTRLLEEHLEQERFERELQLAREIQQRFQPTAPPTVPGYELQGISFPSYQIGGDYYDFILCTDGRLVVALGDVSGKGTSAALLMSSLHAAVHAQVASCRPIKETVGAVNRYLADNTPANRFVTLFYAELDPQTGSLAFINAGHNPPIIAHEGGTFEHLAAGGLPLGIVPDFDYREGRTQLRSGDVLVSYSDGVTETQNPKGEEFGTTRLQEVIAQNISASAAAIRDKIEAALSAFAQGTPAVDDITLLIVKREREE